MPDTPIDFAAEGLLDGLEGEARAERLTLLEALTREGVPLEELRRTTANGTLMFAHADRVIVGERRYTLAEISELTGVDTEFLDQVRRAMGLPVPEREEAVYTDIELNAARRVTTGREAGIADEDLLELLRVLGRSLSQAAQSLRVLPLKLVLEPGLSESELARRYGDAVARLYPLVDPMISEILTLHLRHAAESEVISAMERTGGRLPGSREVAVCFADLVGFTRLGEEIPPEDLAQLAVRLETLASETVRAPVKLVKTIGDAAMLASPEPEPLLASALTLIDMVEAAGEELPQVRAGAAIGEALPRAGDWFGRPVNLASRITAVARPGSLLAADELRERASVEGYSFSFAGQRRLRGVHDPVRLFRVRREP
ncbi:MAG TPA: adenylate cyclase regulatory domain-containing protein [Solirubrobacteraceae bacterium]|nr:adenylate cyclase regulatory domain-containing protein [Solirubrobacteraceae bacterium]